MSATQNHMTTCLETCAKERFAAAPIDTELTTRRRPDETLEANKGPAPRPPDYKREPFAAFATHSGKSIRVYNIAIKRFFPPVRDVPINTLYFNFECRVASTAVISLRMNPHVWLVAAGNGTHLKKDNCNQFAGRRSVWTEPNFFLFKFAQMCKAPCQLALRREQLNLMQNWKRQKAMFRLITAFGLELNLGYHGQSKVSALGLAGKRVFDTFDIKIFTLQYLIES